MKTGSGKCKVLMGTLFMAVPLLCGCDDADVTSVITVTPDSVELARGEAVLLTAHLPEGRGADGAEEDAIYLPLVWSVNNPELGVIVASSGYDAVYASLGRSGQNVVFVKDQRRREGLAVINQR